MRRSALPVITAGALFAAAIAVIAASVVWQPPVAGSPAGGAASASVVRQFYAAVNDAIATGDLSEVQRVVAPHYVEQEPLPGVRPGREGLEDFLQALHLVDPGMRLEMEAIVADDSQVAARVAVRSDDGAPLLAGAVIDASSFWGPVDVFRVVGDTIVERWGRSDELIVPRALADVALDLPAPAPGVVTIERVVLDPGRGWQSQIPGPRLFHLEEGTLRVTATTGSGPRARLVDAPEPAEAATRTLSTGGSWVATGGAGVELTNPGDRAARLLVVTFAVPQTPGGALSSAEALPPPTAGRILAGGLATDVGVGAATLTLDQLTLARHARLSLSSGEGPSLIAVEEGSLDITAWGTAWGQAWVRRGSDGMSAAVDAALVTAGDSLLLHPGPTVQLRNAGGEPAVVLLLTLRPAPAATAVVPDDEDVRHALMAVALDNRRADPTSPAPAPVAESFRSGFGRDERSS